MPCLHAQFISTLIQLSYFSYSNQSEPWEVQSHCMTIFNLPMVSCIKSKILKAAYTLSVRQQLLDPAQNWLLSDFSPFAQFQPHTWVPMVLLLFSPLGCSRRLHGCHTHFRSLLRYFIKESFHCLLIQNNIPIGQLFHPHFSFPHSACCYLLQYYIIIYF